MKRKIALFVLGVLVGGMFLVLYPNGSSPQNNVSSFQKINNGIPVYYIGNETPKYFARATKLTGFKKINGSHILVVEGLKVKDTPQFRKLIRAEVLSGTPVIVTDNPELIRGIFKGQFNARITGGQNPDGTSPKERVYGYIAYRLPDGTLASKVFISIDSSPEAMKDAYYWVARNFQLGG
jgi:hypothetical protein